MNPIRKGLAIAVILLFIGLAFAPSINANVGKEELFEFTTEVCGLNGRKQTVKLTQQQADEVEEFFNSIRKQLNATNSREEAEEIFKDAAVKLDKYGLLGGLSVKQAQRLVTGGYQNPRVIDFIDKLKQNSIGSLVQGSDHHSCLVGGYVNLGWAITLTTAPFIALGFLFGVIGIGASELILNIGLFFFGIGILTVFLRNPIPGPQLPCLFLLGFDSIPYYGVIPAGGKTFVQTSENVYTYQNEYTGVLVGFTGLRFRSILHHYFIGYTHYAHFGYY